MEATIIKQIVDNSLSIVISGLFLYLVFHYYGKLGPKIDRLTEEAMTKNHNTDEVSRIADSSIKALSEVANSNTNISKSLEILNVTMKGHQDLVKLLLEDTRETQARLYAHDDRAEKIYTMLQRLHDDRFEKGKEH